MMYTISVSGSEPSLRAFIEDLARLEIDVLNCDVSASAGITLAFVGVELRTTIKTVLDVAASRGLGVGGCLGPEADGLPLEFVVSVPTIGTRILPGLISLNRHPAVLASTVRYKRNTSGRDPFFRAFVYLVLANEAELSDIETLLTSLGDDVQVDGPLGRGVT